jgi:hypothetical protein
LRTAPNELSANPALLYFDQDLSARARRVPERLELLPLKNRSFSAALASGLFLAATTLGLTACAKKIYYYPEYNYSGRPTPPSGILQRVMASYTANGSSGGLEILDGYRDLRGNVQNTIKSYFISGYSDAQPMTILNFPEQTEGFVLPPPQLRLASFMRVPRNNPAFSRWWRTVALTSFICPM